MIQLSKMTEERTELFNCPHCGNKTSIRIKMTLVQNVTLTDIDGEELTLEYYNVAGQCVTCENVLIYGYGEWETDDLPGVQDMTLIYPKKKMIPPFIPKRVRNSYEEAGKVKRISPISFAVMIRRALEYLYKDQKAEGKTLSQQLKNLSDRGIIPSTLSEMSNALKTLGNIGAHASDEEITKEQAEAIDDFFIALIEYVYIGPYKLKRFKESIQKKE